MSSELVGAIIGGIIGVLGTIITQRGSRKVKESEWRQKEYQAKRETLTEVYKSLISIINLFPDESPNDILRNIEYAPNYCLENYDAVFSILDIKFKDYETQISIPNIDYERKNSIRTEISNINYAKEKLAVNKNSYQKAVKEYTSFIDSDKIVFDLYASRNVRSWLVRFEIIIHNVFISGYSVGDPDDPLENTIKIYRRELINAMRKDIGII
ncbi:hypothetical protein [Listeria booriae]|uniref:hypothetical protein n=1 Tax=Listeria booriae TaxID=1552123 RepID=UPI001C8A89AE|nr:hypothetical protein [Listeria booriae]